jgi:transposase-like protein
MLMGVRWYVAYPLSYRHVEELMEERGMPVDHVIRRDGCTSYTDMLMEGASCPVPGVTRR